ncbi:MAG: winged helix-turn-helix transcriptional regulator, partial [Thermoplasmatota archaeon]
GRGLPFIAQHRQTRKIGRPRIVHAHFDHIGIIPYFKRRRPGIEIYASARAWEILETQKAINTINTFSRDIARQMGRESIYRTCDPAWRDDITGIAVSEGDEIDLGNMAVRILETPGHSSCSTSAYVSDLKALFPSDGVGIPYRSSTVISANSNFTRYQESLHRLKNLDMGLKPGVTSYHINKLEKKELIKSFQDGMYRKFFIFEEKVELKIALSDLQSLIVNIIQEEPGISQIDLSKTIGKSKVVVNYHVRFLRDLGLLKLERDGRMTHCFLTPQGAYFTD